MKKFSKRLLSVLLVIAMLIPTGAMTVTTNAADFDIKDYNIKMFINVLQGAYVDKMKITLRAGGIFFGSISTDSYKFSNSESIEIPIEDMIDGLVDVDFLLDIIDNILTDSIFSYKPFAINEVTVSGSEVFKYYISFEILDREFLGPIHTVAAGSQSYIDALYEGRSLLPDFSVRDAYDPVFDKYNFKNPSYVIEDEIYKIVYGNSKGAWLSFFKENGKGHGLCYGMASTTAALLQNRSSIKSFSVLSSDSNLKNAEFIKNISEKSHSSVFNMDAITFIKYGHVYQYGTEIESTENKLKDLYSAVKSYVNGKGDCVVISIWQGAKNNRKNGHAILATGIKETEHDEYVILIDDSNFTTKQELYISKDFSTWSYSVDGYKFKDGSPYNYNSLNGIIAYDRPGSVVYHLGLLAGEKTRSATNYLNENRLLVTSTSSLGENDNLSEIFVTEDLDSETNDSWKLYWIDEDMNSIELSAEDDNSEVTVSDVNSSVSVVLDSNENASFYVDDDTANEVSYSSKNNENANIVFTSVDENGEIVTTTLTGTANGDEVVASETGDGIQVTGLNDITVTYETADGTSETKADVKDGSTVNITVNDDENKVETDWQCKHTDTNHDDVCDSCDNDFIVGHNYEESSVTEPTCTEQGYTTYTCTCGDSYNDDYVDATGHSEEKLTGYKATCTENGLTDGVKCTVCGETRVAQQTIYAKGHSWGDWNLIDDSEKEHTCSVCGETETTDLNCNCNCHSDNAFVRFFYQIARFFWKLFGMKQNQYCDCGKAHW